MSISVEGAFPVCLDSLVTIGVPTLFCFLSEAILDFVVAKSAHLCEAILTCVFVY